jgi:transcriptional antiterminator NusG
MLFEDQEEQTLNSEETPLGEDESLETSEIVSADVESADSSLESEDEQQVEPESVKVSEVASTDPESTDLESEPLDEEQVEPEPVEAPEPASNDAESTDLASGTSEEELVEPEPVEASEPTLTGEGPADQALEPSDEEQVEPEPASAEIESPDAELEAVVEETEPAPSETEIGDVEISEERPVSIEETEPSPSDLDKEDTALETLKEGQAESTEFDQDGRSWFVVHCYSGYENKVRHNLEQRIETMGMKDKIFDIVVPTEEEIEVKEGKRRTVERRVFPGYILVNMVMTEESWYVVRNTPGVTGFVGMGNTPTPLRPEEVSQIIKRMEAEAPRIKVTFKSGERVRIVDGPFNDFRGTVAEIDMERAKVRVMVNFFGRETPVELDFLQVEKA